MLLGNITRITWIIAMTQSGSRICGQVQISWADLACQSGLLKALQAASEYLLSTTRNLQRNAEAITISLQVLPFSY